LDALALLLLLQLLVLSLCHGKKPLFFHFFTQLFAEILWRLEGRRSAVIFHELLSELVCLLLLHLVDEMVVLNYTRFLEALSCRNLYT